MAVDSLSKSLTGFSDLITADVDIRPRITPVLDLSSVKKDAGQIGGMLSTQPISVDSAYAKAVSAKAGYMSNRSSDAISGDSPQAPPVTYNQYNNSPKALSTADIYRQTKNQLSALFAQEPVVNLSIICFDPDFYSPESTLISGMLTSDEDPTYISYDGTVETGIELVITINRTLTELTVYHNPPNGETRTLQFVAPLVAGDVLTISTVPGNKGATLTRTGVDSSILYGVSPQSSWIELLPGSNGIRVYAEGAGIPLTIEYITKYGGM
jgi:hypothetical protein